LAEGFANQFFKFEIGGASEKFGIRHVPYMGIDLFIKPTRVRYISRNLPFKKNPHFFLAC